MHKENIAEKQKECVSEKNRGRNNTAGGGAVYGLGLIGALIYFIQHSSGFWLIFLAILKALVWPVFVVYELLKSFYS